MNDIQRQVIELLEKMDETQQSEVLDYAQQILDESPKSNLQDLIEYSKRSQAELRAKYGDRPMTSSADLINQMREERDEEIANAFKSRG